MERTEFNRRLSAEVRQFVCGGRTESASFLMWYLNNFFRLDREDSIEFVCDSVNDKGIDGVYVDDEDEEIYLFQSKFSPEDNRDQGDVDLRTFVGAKAWFANEKSVKLLLSSTASRELKALVGRLNVMEKIRMGYSVYVQFITNKVFDANANEFLQANEREMEGFDLDDLLRKYTYVAEQEIRNEDTTLLIDCGPGISYALSDGIIARVFSIRVEELMKLAGIEDRTLFYKNVRYGLGKTRVNKEIRKTILETTEHEKVFLYHNGITLICDRLDVGTEGQITIGNYSVINGCQSMLTFYENKNRLSSNMSVLTKIIELNSDSPLIQQITYFTNNQNAISLQDLKSNDRVQRALQTEFRELFPDSILYRIKRGESSAGYIDVIDIDFAAQLIESFYLKNPHNTHLKSNLFSDRYNQIFSRHITAAKIFLAYIVYMAIQSDIGRLKNEQIRDYGLAKFFFTFLIGEILRSDAKGLGLIEDPTDYVTGGLKATILSIKKLWALLVPDINAYIDEYVEQNANFFDYKNVFKSAEFIRTMARKIILDHEKILVRHPEDAFGEIFVTFLSEQSS